MLELIPITGEDSIEDPRFIDQVDVGCNKGPVKGLVQECIAS
jgi:hypothetical protein